MTSLPGSKNFLVGNKAILTLIAAQIALFISSKWFGLDFGQGWTVLVALGSVLLFAVCVAIGAIWSYWRGSRLQFGLLWLGLFVIAVAIPLGWLMSDVRTAQTHAEIRQHIVDKFGEETEGVSRWFGPKSFLQPMPPVDWKQDFFADYYRVHASLASEKYNELILKLPRVQHLSMQSIDMTDEHNRLARALPDLRILHLDFSLLKDSDLESVESLDKLEQIAINGGDVTDASLSSIVKLKRLNFICIEAGGLTSVGLARFKELPQLTELTLCDAEFSEEEATALRGTGIEHLNLSRARFSTEGFALLAGMPNLKSLSVSHTNMEDEHVEGISAIKHLEALDLTENMLTDRSLEYVAQLPRLKKLYLFEEAITPEAIDAFRALRPDCVVE